MPFLLLLLIAAACFPEHWPQPLAWIGIPDGAPAAFAAWTWGGVLALLAAAWFITWRARRSLQVPSAEGLSILRRFAARRRWLHLGQCAYLLVAVYLLGWGWTVQTICTTEKGLLLPGAELVVLAPFFVSLLAAWAIYFDTENLLHDRPRHAGFASSWRERASYVQFHARQCLALLVAPLALLIIDKGLRRAIPGPDFGGKLQLLSVGLVVVVFVSLPWVLRIALGLRPLPAGPVRDRLLACAQRLRFRCSNILVWNTRGGVANAVVVGIVPQLRYVIFTDRLTSELSPDEVEAVFGHEIGHIKHHHMSFYIGFLILSLCALAGAWTAVRSQFIGPATAMSASLNDGFPGATGNGVEHANLVADLEIVPLVTIAGAYVFVVFGFLSRRCERQADVYGCRAVSCERRDCLDHDADTRLAPLGNGLCPTGIRLFIDALEKVACINGISRSRPGWLQSWQHSTIAHRVEFLQRVLRDSKEEVYFQRRVAWVKWGFLAAVLTFIGLLIMSLGWNQLGLI